MTAAVMSNYYIVPTGWRPNVADDRVPLQNWMYAPMAHYPPPPPPNQHHYNAMYPAPSDAQHLLDSHEHLQYSDLSIYPKVETAANVQSSSAHHAQAIAQQLQQHTAFDDQQLQQPIQQLQQSNLNVQQTTNAQPSQPSSQQGTPDQNSKTNRLRKACDSCSIRKVKCDESGPPCRACTALDIPCTFDRPSRRRGPPNRHAESIKRRRVEEPADSSFYSQPSAPRSPTQAAQTLTQLPPPITSTQLSAESICPLQTIDSLINDFFTYIHPLCPFPLEPSFREAWKRRDDATHSEFLALLASMIAAFVSSLPRRPRLHLRTQQRDLRFPDQLDLVNRCQKVCLEARGPGYLTSEKLSVYDAATSYFLGLTGLYTQRWHQARLYFGECLTIIRALGLYKLEEQTLPPLGDLPLSLGFNDNDRESTPIQLLDGITLQMGRRIYCALLMTSERMRALGAEVPELNIRPSSLDNPRPELPVEVDDFCIYTTHHDPQPADYLSEMAGFRASRTVHSSIKDLGSLETAMDYGDVQSDLRGHYAQIKQALSRCEDVLRELPPDLNVRTIQARKDQQPVGHISGDINDTGSVQPDFPQDPASTLLGIAPISGQDRTPSQRRAIQYSIQRANIFVSALSARLYLTKKFWHLEDRIDRIPSAASRVDRDSETQEMQQESEELTRDIIRALGNLDEVNMEPSADNYAARLRCLGSMLLDIPGEWRGELATRIQEPLSAFLDLLLKLERIPLKDGLSELEEQNLEGRLWAELQRYQSQLKELAART